MLKSTRHNLLRSLLWTAIASGGFATVFGVASGAFSRGLLSGIAQIAVFVGSGLLISVWFAVPIGLALGLVLPRLVVGKSRTRAVLVGSTAGIAAGVIVAACLKLMMPLSSLVGLGALSVPYCVLVAAVFALRLKGVGEAEARAA
jgi:hypothetical protein